MAWLKANAKCRTRPVDHSANVSVVKGAARGLVPATAAVAQPARGLAQGDHSQEDQADDQHRRDHLLAFLGRGLGGKGCQSEQRHAGATLAKSAVVCDERLLERRACVSLRQLRERRRVAVVAQRNAGLLELTGPEQRGARSPSCTVAWSRVGPELGTERDQLGQVGNS